MAISPPPASIYRLLNLISPYVPDVFIHDLCLRQLTGGLRCALSAPQLWRLHLLPMLTQTIAETRLLRGLAAVAKAPAQMGDHGHSDDGCRRLCEFVWGGVVGRIIETHSWSNHTNGGAGLRPPTLPVPEVLRWDKWIGPASYEDDHDDLHPHEWHGCYDFGNRTLANMGVHVMDGVFRARQLERPTSIELEEMRDGSHERFPSGVTGACRSHST
jgi:hypothetical protein